MKKKYFLILLIFFAHNLSFTQQSDPIPCGTVGFEWRASQNSAPANNQFTSCPNTNYQLKANNKISAGQSIAPGFNIVISAGSMNITKIEISQGGGAYQNIGSITNITYASPNYEYKVRITGTVITAPVSINIVNHASGSVIASATYSAGVVITIPSGSIDGIATFSGPGVSNYQLNYPAVGKTDYIGSGYGVFNPSIAGNGTHTITYTWNNGNSDCGSATKIVTVSGCASTPSPCLTGPTPNATITPQDTTTFCQGDSVNLNAPIDSSYTYQWYNNNQPISEATTHTWKASATGAYTVKISNGSCEAISAPIQVKVNPLPLASIFPSGNLISICEGTSITLKASGGTKYKWNSGETTSEVIVNTSGAHYVNVYNENGCKSNAGLDISIKKNPKVSIENAPTVTSSQSYVCMNNGFNLQATGAKGQEKYKWYASETDASPIYNDSVYNYTPNRWEDNKLVFEGDTLVKYFWVSITDSTCESPKTKYKIEVIVTPGNLIYSHNKTYCSGDYVNLYINNENIQYLPSNFDSWKYRYTWHAKTYFNDQTIFEGYNDFGMEIRINNGGVATRKTINETGKEISTHFNININQGNGFNNKYCELNNGGGSNITVSPSLKLRTTKTTNSSITMAWDTITPAPTNYTINYRINKDTTNHKESLKEVYSYTVSNLKKGDTVYFSIIPNGINCAKTYETIGVAEEKIIPCNIPTQNLVGWWPFNGNINDESGYGNHGQLNEWYTTTFTKDRFGNENKAYEFSNNNYSPIKIPYSSILNSTSMTFSSWFKTKNLPTSIWDSRILITKPNAYGIKIALTPSTAKNYINVNRNYEAGYTSKMEIDTNNWYHFVYVHDEKTGSKLFINGKLENSSSDNGPLTTNFDRICFGGENNWSNFKGYLDDIAIFNKALDSNEVKALYNQTCNQETATLKLLNETRINAYPNPTSDVLHIEIGDAKALEGFRYRILDALGKEVYNELVKNTLTEIPLKTLGAAGMYQLEILDANKTSIQTNKIVLQ